MGPTRPSSSSSRMGADGASVRVCMSEVGGADGPAAGESSSVVSGGALRSSSSRRLCNSCLSSVGWTCEELEAEYSGAGDDGGRGSPGVTVLMSAVAPFANNTGAGLEFALIVRVEPVAVRASSSVSRRCIDGD